MRWGKTDEQIDTEWQRKRQWNAWFAWYPVRTSDGWVWLETVYRKYYRSRWEYTFDEDNE